MNTLTYNGFGNTPSSCQYAIGGLGGKTALVFYESKAHGTSITNMIEVLTTHILATDLQGHAPSSVRVFEHYDPAMNPLVEWQEVSFAQSGKVNSNTNVLQKLLALVSPSGTLPTWYVDGPTWSPVSKSDVAVLAGIQ